MPVRLGGNTLEFYNMPKVVSSAAVVGKKEKNGPLGNYFDICLDDTTFGEKSFEKSESKMQKEALGAALSKANLLSSDIDFVFAGDLLNQCISSSFGLMDFKIPYFGLYGACSTMAESIIISSVFIASGAAKKAAAVTSSHFCSAERQYRFPLEYGGQRPQSSQWTVTGAGAVILGDESNNGVKIKHVTPGKIEDFKVKDANNMGAAMAPAAANTLLSFFKDTNTSPSDYDLVLTGDLGSIGSDLLKILMKRENCDISVNHNDCGCMIYNRETQDVHSGGSGCGCSASVLSSYILPKLSVKDLKEVLFVATGALLSPTSTYQGESIPSVAHLVHFEA